MGQYHLTVNLDKREFINPHKIGLGLKLLEQCGFKGSTGDILFMLLACSNGRGGGDISTDFPELIGRWAGDRIAVIGDYSEADDIPGVDARNIYRLCINADTPHIDPADQEKIDESGESLFKDISDELIPLINEQFECGLNIEEKGWRPRKQKTPLRPDMLLRFPLDD